MAENYSGFAGAVATGTDKTLWNLYDSVATPTRRARIYDIWLGSVAATADVATRFQAQRTTGLGTPAATYTPNNLDPGGPAGECTLGQGAYSVEPTYTSNKELLVVSCNQRTTVRWLANPGRELVCAATQNNGIGFKSKSSTATPAYESTVLFEE